MCATLMKLSNKYIYPTNFLDEKSKKATGHTIEYLRDLIDEIGFDIDFIGPLPFHRLLTMLKNGDIGALLGMSWIKDRAFCILS